MRCLAHTAHGLSTRAGDATRHGAGPTEIYGDPEIHPQNEEYWGNVNPIGVRACYDEGKRVAGTAWRRGRGQAPRR